LIESKITVKEVSIDEAICTYLKQETTQKRTKYSTEALYFWELKEYLTKNHQIDPQAFVSEIRPVHMRSFQNWLKSSDRPGKPITASTVNRRFHTYKHFFKKCIEWEYIKESPTRFIRTLSETPKARKTWTDSELEQIRELLSFKELAVFDFLLETGARLSSALLLEWGEVDLNGGSVTFRTRKGARSLEKLYQVPLSKKAQLIIRTQGIKKEGRVFDLSAERFSKQIGRKIKKAGLGGRSLTLHGLRHTFATRLHKKGASTESIRRLLGHFSTKTTESYLETDLDFLKTLIA
jgi:integrase/recombinase XerC